MKSSQVAIDASFLLKIFLPEEKSEKAEKIWIDWINDSVEAGKYCEQCRDALLYMKERGVHLDEELEGLLGQLYQKQ